MTTAPIRPTSPGGSRRLRWTREEYVRAADEGLFGERTVELLEGELYEKIAENRPHRSASSLTAEALRTAFGSAYNVREELGLPLGPFSQPKPDVFVLRGTAREFATVREEGPEDVALVVEIADTRRDTAQRKVRLYGAAGLPEYWILDLRTRTLVVHREPHAKGCGSIESYPETALVAPLERPERTVVIAELLP